MPRETIRSLLLIDEDAGQRRLVSAIAARAGWRTVVAESEASALASLRAAHANTIEAILIDQRDDTPALVAQLRTAHPDKAVYVLTTMEVLAVAVEALRAGATDYLVKPIAPDRLLAALDAAANRQSIEGELRPMAEKLWQPLSFEEIVGSAPAFRAAVAIAEKSAAARVPVLIEGERGTGKEMIADAIHAASPRAQRPLMVLD
jgi:DNA-binding NtrC family response regulator